MKMGKVAALVILYQYAEDVIDNIKTYAKQMDLVYAYDNSETKQEDLVLQLKQIENLVYLDAKGNQGLAQPINQVAKMAMQQNIFWMVTFDQDSRVGEDFLPMMREFYDNYRKKDKIGLIGPVVNDGKTDFGLPTTPYSYYDKIIQSGALHNLLVLEELQGYDENLFIDQVDMEYCVRLIQRGYQIVKLNSAILTHNVSDEASEVKMIHGRKVTLYKYSVYRYYYIIRNNLYCNKIYRKVNKPYVAETKRNIRVMFDALKHEPNKNRKRKAIIYAYMDYLFGRMGKCQRKL